MPHLRLQVPEEWLRADFQTSTGFHAQKLLDQLVQVVADLRMPNPAGAEPPTVPFINLQNLKHAIEPLYYAHVAGDGSKHFLHVTLSAGNDTPGRTAEVRKHVSQVLGNAIDKFIAGLPGFDPALLASVTTWVQDIDRDRGYSTTAERKKKRTQI